MRRPSAVLLVAGALAAVNPVAPASAATPRCHGHVATIVGTEHDDTLVGTDGPDVIVALGGSDRIDSGLGRDVICGDSGGDRIYFSGGDGSSYFGGEGNDEIVLDSDTAPRLVSGGPGKDTVSLQTCLDCTVRAGSGRDRVDVWSSQGIDLFGGAGSDYLHANLTYPGDNAVHGGTGDDGLVLGFVPPATSSVYERLTLDLARGWVSLDGDRAPVTSFDDAELSGAGIDASRLVLRGTDGPNWLGVPRTTQAPVTVIGRAGRDRLHGGSGDDLLRGGPGKDRAIGYGGDDTCLSTEKSRHCEVTRRGTS